MKKIALFIYVSVFSFGAGCAATTRAYTMDDQGFWHCPNDVCHWHEYGVMEEYYVSSYDHHYAVLPPPPGGSVWYNPDQYPNPRESAR